MSGKKIDFISIDDLELDKSNPRLPSVFKKKKISERDIVNWMLQDASIIELMLAIGNSGFFIGEALLVVEEGGKYIVIEGNRRLTSTKLLNNPDLAEVHRKKIEQVIKETDQRPKELPCIVFENRSKINKYLGYRHVTGVKSWGVLQKARYLKSLLSDYEMLDFSKQCRELAKAIGSRSDHVRKLLIAYDIYEVIEDNAFFNISGLDETSIFFNYYSDSIGKENIRDFIGVDIQSDLPIEGLNTTNLEELTKWFFKKNDQDKARVLGDSKSLGMLDKVLGNDEARGYFRHGEGSLQDAFQIVAVSSSSFSHEIEMALSGLKRAQNIVHKVDRHDNPDAITAKLKEIFTLAKHLKVIVESSEDEGWND